jgi:hypothetical protein
VFRALAEYVPPPRTITAMYHGGQLDEAQASKYLLMNGLTPELAKAYLSPSHTHPASGAEKHLAKSDILAAYTDKIMTRADALAALAALKYPEHEAGLLLDLADLRALIAANRAGINRIRALFQAGKITATEAARALAELDVGDQQAKELIDVWTVAQAHAVRELTPAQIMGAVKYNLISADDGIARLVGLGYDPADAWLALAEHLHGTGGLPPRPPGLGPAPPGGA